MFCVAGIELLLSRLKVTVFNLDRNRFEMLVLRRD